MYAQGAETTSVADGEKTTEADVTKADATEPIETIEAVTEPKEALDCFTVSPMFGDLDENHVTTSDLDKLD